MSDFSQTHYIVQNKENQPDDEMLLRWNHAVDAIRLRINDAQNQAKITFDRDLPVDEVYKRAFLACELTDAQIILGLKNFTPEQLLFDSTGHTRAKSEILLEESIEEIFSEWLEE